ncbi:hypothetical protein ES703_20655 [subsurface metagenome]
MGVLFRRTAMGGPASVPHSKASIRSEGFQVLDKVADLAFDSPQMDLILIHHRNSGGVVPPVFKHLQPIHEDGDHISLPDIPDDPAHYFFLFLRDQFFFSICLLRDTARASGETFLVIVEPAPM